MNSFKAMLLRSRRLLITLVSIVVIYTLVGIFLVPWLAEKQLAETMQQRLGVQSTVQKIAFNPYTFELTVDGLQLDTAEREPLAGWDKLYINVEPMQLFKLDLTIDEISLTSPRLYFRRFSTTDNTLSRLADKWASTAEPDETESADKPEDNGSQEPLLTFRLNKLNYSKGELHYRDEVPADKFETVLSPINIHLTDFSTQTGQRAKNQIVIDLENDAELTLDGQLALSPLHLNGQLSLDNLSLQMPYRYLRAMLPFELKEGRANLDLAYKVEIKDAGAEVKLDQVQLDLADFSVNQLADGLPLLQAGQLKLRDGQFSYPQNTLTIASLQLDDYTLAATQNKEGQLNWLQMLDAIPARQAEDSSTETKANPIKLDIANIAINNSQVELEDRVPETPVNMSVNINTTLNDFSMETGKQMPLTADLTLGSGGTIGMTGDVQIFPAFALNSQVSIDKLALLPLQPYLEKFAFVSLKKGGIDAKVKMSSNQDEPLTVQGDLALVDLQLDNQKLNEKLLGLDNLAFNSIDFSLAKQNLAISEITVDKLYSRIKINDGGNTNIGLLLKDKPEATTQETTAQTEAEKETAYNIAVGKVTINEASSDYTDENLPIVFNANMQKLNGHITGFSTESQQPMKIDLEGQVDEFGLVEIDGDMNPLDLANQTSIKLVFTNLTLPGMTPYTIKFAGREIDQGSADITLDYEVVKGELNANNKLVIKDIRLGKRVESPDAMDLPLDLAVALLKNSDGIIDLSIPVSGNLNDPQFDIGPVIRHAISNVIGNIVTAPFRFLANLFGGDGEPVKDLRFRPGRSDIAPPEQEKLLKLAGALQKRPQLALEIPAPFDKESDRQVLKQKAVEARIEARLKDTHSETPLSEKTRQVLETLYAEAKLSPGIETMKQEMIEAKKTSDQPDGSLDVLALNAKLKARLIEAEQVNQTTLERLASERQQQVIAFMQSNGLREQQLLAGDVTEQTLDDGWIVLPFKLDAL